MSSSQKYIDNRGITLKDNPNKTNEGKYFPPIPSNMKCSKSGFSMLWENIQNWFYDLPIVSLFISSREETLKNNNSKYSVQYPTQEYKEWIDNGFDNYIKQKEENDVNKNLIKQYFSSNPTDSNKPEWLTQEEINNEAQKQLEIQNIMNQKNQQNQNNIQDQYTTTQQNSEQNTKYSNKTLNQNKINKI